MLKTSISSRRRKDLEYKKYYIREVGLVDGRKFYMEGVGSTHLQKNEIPVHE